MTHTPASVRGGRVLLGTLARSLRLERLRLVHEDFAHVDLEYFAQCSKKAHVKTLRPAMRAAQSIDRLLGYTERLDARCEVIARPAAPFEQIIYGHMHAQESSVRLPIALVPEWVVDSGMRIKSEADYHWQRILRAFDYSCAYCGTDREDVVLCKEHTMPRSRGGDDSIENVVPSCRSCNSSKGNLTPLEWLLVQVGWFRSTSPKRAQSLTLVEPEPPRPQERRASLMTYGRPVPIIVTDETPHFYCFRVEQFYKPFVTRWLWPNHEYKAKKDGVVFAEDSATQPPPASTPEERDRHA